MSEQEKFSWYSNRKAFNVCRGHSSDTRSPRLSSVIRSRQYYSDVHTASNRQRQKKFFRNTGR